MKIFRMNVVVLFVAFCFLHFALSFDMWETIEKSNEEFQKAKKGQSDDNGARLVGGDIHLTLQDWKDNRKALSSPPQHSPSGGRTFSSPNFSYHRRYWKRRIPYFIESYFNAEERQTIEKSLRLIEEASCLKFYKRSGSEKNWIRFYKGSGCFSGIGRKYYARRSTDISLGGFCVSESIIVHEVLHALGFYHEQSRLDRDSYVNVFMYNVKPSMKSNFDKNDISEADYQGTPYDYTSIMQYGKTAFRKMGAGNTMESKFNPNQPLGGPKLSSWDILELNRRYQCKHEDAAGNIVPAITSGWSKWVGYTKCTENWKKECTKTRYRFCVDSDSCSGANEHGTQETVVECTPRECADDKNAIDGGWGAWSKLTKCSGACGWGVTQRTRDCNNPTPKGSGKKCAGNSMERSLCRKKRCSANGISLDTNFDKGFGQWKAVNFIRKSGRASYVLKADGPSQDHTSQVEGTSGGFYAAGISEKGYGHNSAKKEYKSELMVTTVQTHAQSCLSFFYMLNGNQISPNAITIYMKLPDGSYSNSPFNQGGHQGNQWKRASINLGKISAGTKIYIEVRYMQWYGSVVAIDDIVFDNNKCPVIPTKCQDTEKDCSSKKSQCAFEWRTMIPKCCRTCSDPSLKILGEVCMNNPKHASNCDGWAQRKVSECNKNPKFMKKNCCKSCSSVPAKAAPQPKPTCSDNSEYSSKCPRWAKLLECSKNSWMKKNCCNSCKAHCKDKYDSKKCKRWAEDKEKKFCKSEKNKKWMGENCCLSCMNSL